jgi:hypothetical protein
VPRESSLLDLVHSDICGPIPHQSLGRASYFVTFIDDATRKVWAYPTQTKDRVFTIFKDWVTMVENQADRKLKCLRSINGESINLTSSSNFAGNAVVVYAVHPFEITKYEDAYRI